MAVDKAHFTAPSKESGDMEVMLAPSGRSYVGLGLVLIAAYLLLPAAVAIVDARQAVTIGKLIELVAAASIAPVCANHLLRKRHGGRPTRRSLFLYTAVYSAAANLALVTGLITALWPRYTDAALAQSACWLAAMGILVAHLGWFLLYDYRRDLVQHFNDRLRAAQLEAEKAQSQHRLAEARLAALQAQIEPHFLHNTLANLQFLLDHDVGAAQRMLADLVRYLKASVPPPDGSPSTLMHEFELSAAYLDLVRARLGDRLTVSLSLPDELRAVEFPRSLIQTLVENSIKHGIARQPGPVSISLRAHICSDELSLEVADTGAGFGGATGGTGVGLNNIREQLRALYGDAAKLRLQGNQPRGVRARITIPVPTPSS